MTRAPEPSARDLYLDLLERSVLGAIERDGAHVVLSPAANGGGEDAFLKTDVRLTARTDAEYDPEARREGLDWPRRALSMIGGKRMANLRWCLETALADGVPGDFIETGVFRGGACIFARGVLKAHGAAGRAVWVADSFRGLPLHEVDRYPADRDFKGLWRKVLPLGMKQPSLDEVKDAFARYGLLDEQVRFLPGWFKDTLPAAPIERLAVIRLDGDMYSSTMDALEGLYPRLSPGGFVIVDDYAIDACRKAVEDYRERHRLTEPITRIDTFGAWWRRDAHETKRAERRPQTLDVKEDSHE